MSVRRSYPDKMKAVFLEKEGGPLVVKEVPVPEPGPGEVLIKIAAAPVNPSDLASIRNAHLNSDLATFIPGIEGSGTVIKAGKGILPALWMGKRVACTHSGPASGTWAEYMVTEAGACSPLSKNINDEQGSMTFVNPLSAVAFLEIAKEGGHKAIINNAAASALGRMVELLCKKKNIPLINIVRRPEQVISLKETGSKFVLDSSAPAFIDDLKLLSNELNATLLFDSVCSPQLELMIGALPYGSSVIIYGNLTGEENIRINPRNLIANDIKVSGFFLGDRSRKNGMLKNMKNIMQVSRLMKSGMEIKVRSRFPLSKVQEAVDSYLSDMSAGKVLLVPGDGSKDTDKE